MTLTLSISQWPRAILASLAHPAQYTRYDSTHVQPHVHTRLGLQAPVYCDPIPTTTNLQLIENRIGVFRLASYAAWRAARALALAVVGGKQVLAARAAPLLHWTPVLFARS